MTAGLHRARRRRQQTTREPWEQAALASPRYCARKLAACLLLARDCSRASWQYPEARAEFLQIKREALADARAWFEDITAGGLTRAN